MTIENLDISLSQRDMAKLCRFWLGVLVLIVVSLFTLFVIFWGVWRVGEATLSHPWPEHILAWIGLMTTVLIVGKSLFGLADRLLSK